MQMFLQAQDSTPSLLTLPAPLVPPCPFLLLKLTNCYLLPRPRVQPCIFNCLMEVLGGLHPSCTKLMSLPSIVLSKQPFFPLILLKVPSSQVLKLHTWSSLTSSSSPITFQLLSPVSFPTKMTIFPPIPSSSSHFHYPIQVSSSVTQIIAVASIDRLPSHSFLSSNPSSTVLKSCFLKASSDHAIPAWARVRCSDFDVSSLSGCRGYGENGSSLIEFYSRAPTLCFLCPNIDFGAGRHYINGISCWESLQKSRSFVKRAKFKKQLNVINRRHQRPWVSMRLPRAGSKSVQGSDWSKRAEKKRWIPMMRTRWLKDSQELKKGQ